MGRSPCCEKEGMKKGPWTPEEDQKLLAYIEQHGHGSWRALPAKAGLQRCGKSCRLRWTNYLRPDIKRGKFSLQEEQTIIQLHALLGNRWSAIASHLPKRTDNEIKNFWNTHLKKRLAKMGIDPVTHKPKCDALSPADGHGSKTAANLSHMAQWESARLEAEARLVRESRLVVGSSALLSAAASCSSSANSTINNAPFQLLPQFSSATTASSGTGSSTAGLHVNVLPSASPSSSLPPACLDVVHRSWQQSTCTKSMSVDDGGQCSRAGKIDLESPTSTLTFSENFLPVGATGFREHVSSLGHQDPGRGGGIPGGSGGGGGGGGGEDNMEGEEVEWKCFPTPMQLFDHKERTDSFMRSTLIQGISSSSSSVFGSSDINVSSWLNEPFKIGMQASAAAATGGNFGDGFTEMLLHDSDCRHKYSCEDAGGGCDDEFAAGTTEKGSAGAAEVNEEENKSYWNSILNLVNSSSPSNSQTGF